MRNMLGTQPMRKIQSGFKHLSGFRTHLHHGLAIDLFGATLTET